MKEGNLYNYIESFLRRMKIFFALQRFIKVKVNGQNYHWCRMVINLSESNVIHFYSTSLFYIPFQATQLMANQYFSMKYGPFVVKYMM